MNYNGNNPYIFVSYSHSDRRTVEYILGYMERAGIRFWYDDSIEAGDNWKDVIDNKLNESSRFLLFLSNVAHQRDEVIRELKKAVRMNENNPDYKIIVVMLEYVPIKHSFKNDKELTEVFERLQYLFVPKYGGVTFEFLKRLLSYSLWPEVFRDESVIQESGFINKLSDSAIGVIDDNDDVMRKNDYIYSLAFPEKCNSDGLEFYKVRIGETDKNSVYPICMDNQWCPTELLNDPHFIKEGFGSDIVSMMRDIAQMNEIHRALLHNWQLIINRASIFNTDSLISIYKDNGETGKAFCELMENGSIVVFLFSESSPVEEPKFDHDKQAFEAWKKLCQEHTFYFLRLDWDDENNKVETDLRISAQFRNMLMCVADDKSRLKMICDVLNIPKEKRDEFRNIWKEIRSNIIDLNENNTIDGLVDYRRNELYKKFLILDKTKVNYGIMDYEKPFVKELKRVVDLCYCLNLPYAIGVSPVADYDDELWKVLTAEMRQDPNVRLLSVDELYCAVMSFVPDFIDTDVYYPLDTIVNLSEVSGIRTLLQWNQYMQMVDTGRKRSGLNEIDFSDVRKIWLSFHNLLGICKTNYGYHKWVRRKGSLTVIYRFGEYKLTVIYNGGSKKIKIIPHHGDISFSRARGSLRIEFVCVDITETNIKNTPYFTVQCLFDGKINEHSREAYETILSALKESDYEILEVNPSE